MSEMALDLIARAKRERWKRLDLGRCGIVGAVPDEVGDLGDLEELILSDSWWDWKTGEWKKSQNRGPANNIAFLPTKLPSRLVVLISRNNEIDDLLSIEGLEKLRVLDISVSKVSNINPLKGLTQLQHLHLGETQIVDFTPLKGLIQLIGLYLEAMNITDVAPLKGLVQLQKLRLPFNPIADVGPLRDLILLQYLDLQHTKVTDIGSLQGLRQLNFLDLRSSLVTDISPLKGLMLRKENPLQVNNIIFKENTILVQGCPLTNPPREIALQGAAAILRYWKRKDEEAATDSWETINWHCKLVIVGNAGVGKSTLLAYLKDAKGAAQPERTEWMEVAEWSPGCEFPAKAVDEEGAPAGPGRARVQVFDFGGQEYYHDTHHLFFSTNTAYLVLWNSEKNRLGKDPALVDDEATAASYHYPLEYWLDAIRHLNGISAMHPEEEIARIKVDEDDKMTGEEFALTMRHAMRGVYEPYWEFVNGVPALVVQTHVDQSGIEFLDQRRLTQEFPWIMDFESVSLNPQKPMRLEILEAKLLELIAKIPILGAAFSTTYAWVRDAVQEYPEQATLSKLAFRNRVNAMLDKHTKAIGRNMDKLHFGEAETEDLIGYLGSLGSLLHFPHGALADRVFLRPDLLKATILELLRNMSRKRGFFTQQEAAAALAELPNPRQLEEVLALLQEFKMAFRIGPPEDGLWAAPLYLPEEAPEGIELLLQVFDRPLRRIAFRHFIHKSVVLEFFQQHVEEIKSQVRVDEAKSYLVWRNGMVLQTPDSKELVLVRFFIGESEPQYYGGGNGPVTPAHIDIFSFGEPPSGKAPAEDVLERLKTITKGWRVEQAVTVDGVHFVPLAKLEAASWARETHFVHEGKTFALEDYAQYVEIPWDRLYISYAEEDEAFCKAFEKHIWPLQQRDKLIIWSKGQLKAGMQTDAVQRLEMEKANIIVLMLSADYFYDRDIWQVELKTALARAAHGACKLAVVVVRACDWKATELAEVHQLNHGLIVGDPGADQAWVDVVGALRGILKTRKENFYE